MEEGLRDEVPFFVLHPNGLSPSIETDGQNSEH